MQLDRRDAVLGLGALALTGAVVTAVPRERALLAALFKDRTTARALGRVWLRLGGEPEASLARGRALLAGATDTAGLRRQLQAARDTELRGSGIVLVDGWVLARSEADLLAVAAVA